MSFNMASSFQVIAFSWSWKYGSTVPDSTSRIIDFIPLIWNLLTVWCDMIIPTHIRTTTRIINRPSTIHANEFPDGSGGSVLLPSTPRQKSNTIHQVGNIHRAVAFNIDAYPTKVINNFYL